MIPTRKSYKQVKKICDPKKGLQIFLTGTKLDRKSN
jgi:hypothetical protein